MLSCATPTPSAAAWLAPTAISTADCGCGAPAAATDAAGDLTVAFWNGFGLTVARHPAGGTWSSPVPIGPPTDPVLAGNGEGDTVVAYGYQYDVGAIVDTAGEPWSAVAASTLSTAGTQTAPSVAIDGRGDALVAWETPASWIDVAYRPAGGAWQPPVTVDDQAVAKIAPAVAFTPAGAATMVWASQNGGDEAVVSSTMNPDGSWTFPTQIATETLFYAVQVVMDSHGDATAAWTAYDGTNDVLGVAERPAGGPWHADGNLAAGVSSDGPNPESFGLAINAAGEAALVWNVGLSNPQSIAAAVRPAGGAWSTPTTLATVTSGFMADPQVVVDVGGTVTADWSVDYADVLSAGVWADQESPGGMWSSPTVISQPFLTDFGDVTVVDPAGDVDIVASLFNDGASPVWSMVSDAGGPALDGLAVPARGTVGVPVDFSVSPLDAWSAILATHWSFGDGTTATDESVSHVYTTPGTYTVTASSSDILGNTSSQNSTIVIAAAPTTGSGVPNPGPASTTAAAPTPVSTATGGPPPTPVAAGSTPVARLTLRVTQAHPRWREPTRSAATGRPPIDTHFVLTVNQSARVTLMFSQVLAGRRRHDRCRSINATDRNDPRCVRNVTLGELSLPITTAGRRRLDFTGRLGARRLGPGHYTVTIRATGAGGTATDQLSFTITN